MVQHTQYKKLSKEEQSLLQEARESANQSTAEYSHTHVGAALLTDQGKVIRGANLENAPFDSVCTERTALLTANVLGERNIKLLALYVKKMHDNHKKPSVMCAKCRVMVAHHERKYQQPIKIISVCPEMKTVYRFGVEDLV